MTTLGARGCPSLEGVPGPEAPAGVPPGLIGPCAPKPWAPPASDPDEGWGFCCAEGTAAPSAEGTLLLRASLRAVCDDVGVA
jgi:hypothetical protein